MMDQYGSPRFEPLRLSRGTTHVQPVDDDDRLFVVHGRGGGCVLQVEGTAVAAWMPLQGTLHVRTAGLNIALHAKWALMTGPETGLRATASAGSMWLALVGSEAAWRHLMVDVPPNRARLLPAMHAVDRSLLSRVAALMRSGVPDGPEDSLRALASEVVTLQAPLYHAIARSPGRCFAAKLQVFLRLQRVRRFMMANCERELDNDALAAVANYSPCHFLRTFKAVYQETPHTYLIRQRLRHAERLLRSGELAVTEVALASGFENRSAFSRRYRQAFGVTANEVRRHNAPDKWRRAG